MQTTVTTAILNVFNRMYTCICSWEETCGENFQVKVKERCCLTLKFIFKRKQGEKTDKVELTEFPMEGEERQKQFMLSPCSSPITP